MKVMNQLIMHYLRMIFFELVVKTNDIDLSKFYLILDIIKEIIEDE